MGVLLDQKAWFERPFPMVSPTPQWAPFSDFFFSREMRSWLSLSDHHTPRVSAPPFPSSAAGGFFLGPTFFLCPPFPRCIGVSSVFFLNFFFSFRAVTSWPQGLRLFPCFFPFPPSITPPRPLSPQSFRRNARCGHPLFLDSFSQKLGVTSDFLADLFRIPANLTALRF